MIEDGPVWSAFPPYRISSWLPCVCTEAADLPRLASLLQHENGWVRINAAKTMAWIGQGPNLYALKLGGSQDGRHQGQYVTDEGRWYLRQVPRKQVSVVTAALFDHYQQNRASSQEDMGAYIRRVGIKAIVAFLKTNADTTDLMEKSKDAPYVPEGQWR